MEGYKAYEGDGITVYWNPKLCTHAEACVHNLPQVFDVDRRPWVDVTAASANEIAGVIDLCPSGALRYERKAD